MLRVKHLPTSKNYQGKNSLVVFIVRSRKGPTSVRADDEPLGNKIRILLQNKYL